MAADAADTSPVWQVSATYAHAGETRTVSADAWASVTGEPVLSPGSMSATADSENGSSGSGEGPVANVLDGDAGTIWHTDYTASQGRTARRRPMTGRAGGPLPAGAGRLRTRWRGGGQSNVSTYSSGGPSSGRSRRAIRSPKRSSSSTVRVLSPGCSSGPGT